MDTRFRLLPLAVHCRRPLVLVSCSLLLLRGSGLRLLLDFWDLSLVLWRLVAPRLLRLVSLRLSQASDLEEALVVAAVVLPDWRKGLESVLALYLLPMLALLRLMTFAPSQ